MYLPSSLELDFAAATVYTFFGTAQSTATVLFATTFPLTFFIAYLREKKCNIRTSKDFFTLTEQGTDHTFSASCLRVKDTKAKPFDVL